MRRLDAYILGSYLEQRCRVRHSVGSPAEQKQDITITFRPRLSHPVLRPVEEPLPLQKKSRITKKYFENGNVDHTSMQHDPELNLFFQFLHPVFIPRQQIEDEVTIALAEVIGIVDGGDRRH